MYLVALVPVAVGGAAAIAAAAGTAAPAPLPWPLLASAGRTLSLAAAGAAATVAWLNLSNDAWDAGTGVDAAKPESVVNLLGGRVVPVHLASAAAAVAGAAWLSGALRAAGCGSVAWWGWGGGGGAAAAASAGDPRPAALLAAAIAAGYMYQGPPFRLSYAGLGEPLCFAAFGPAATTAFFLVGAGALGVGGGGAPHQAGPLTTPAAAAAAALVGLSTTAVLFCSHFHQVAGDRAAGKRSPLVRLGGDTAAGAAWLGRGVGGAYALLAVAALAGWLPMPASLTALALSWAPARTLLARAAADHGTPPRARTLKLAALGWHGGLGAGLCLGLAGPAVLASARAAGLV